MKGRRVKPEQLVYQYIQQGVYRHVLTEMKMGKMKGQVMKRVVLDKFIIQDLPLVVPAVLEIIKEGWGIG